MNSAAWLQYYQQNRLNRPEPDWNLPLLEAPTIVGELARSLSHFQLGETGEGTCLLRQAAREHAGDPIYQEALVLYIREEQEHARLLLKLVGRFHGRQVTKHWTHSLFRLLRRAAGVGFEIQVLVIAELIGTTYYRLLGGKAHDPVLRHVCEILVRDEARHLVFHAERLGTDQDTWLPVEKALWQAQFQALFLGAVRVAWADHGRALRHVGTTSAEFQREARSECIQFLANISPGVVHEQLVPRGA